MSNPDTSLHPEQTLDILQVELGEDFLAKPDSPLLAPWDRVAIRQLPWWETPQTVTVTGEVFYPGEFSLAKRGETR